MAHASFYGNPGCGRRGAPSSALPQVTCATHPARFAYVVNGGANSVSAYAIDAAAGTVTAFSYAVRSGAQPSAVAIDPTDTFAYVVNRGAGTVSVFAIDPTRGALNPINGSPFVAGPQPTAIAISD